MKCPGAGAVVLAALALSGCSGPEGVREFASNLRDRVATDAATAAAERAMRPSPTEYGGGGGPRPRPQPTTPRQPGQADPNAKPGEGSGSASDSGSPPPAPPPPVAYYYSPTGAPGPAQ